MYVGFYAFVTAVRTSESEDDSIVSNLPQLLHASLLKIGHP